MEAWLALVVSGWIVDLLTGLLAISNDTYDLINFTVINFNILTINLISRVLTAATDLSVGDVEEAALRVFVFHFEGQDEVALLIEWAGWIILT